MLHTIILDTCYVLTIISLTICAGMALDLNPLRTLERKLIARRFVNHAVRCQGCFLAEIHALPCKHLCPTGQALKGYTPLPIPPNQLN